MSDESQRPGNAYESMYPTCKSCGRMIRNDPESTPICEDCREKFIRYPFPKKIVIPSIIVLILVAVITVIRFPQALQAGIHFERGIRAIDQHAYVTAEENLKLALAQYPDSPEILSNLTIAYHENGKTQDAMVVYDKMADKQMEVEDKAVFQRITAIADEVSQVYNIPEAYMNEHAGVMALPENERVTKLRGYVVQYPDSVYIRYFLADVLFDTQDFDGAKLYIDGILQMVPDYIPAISFLAAIHREKGDYDKAIEICNSLLRRNSESVFALSALSRIELKRFNDAKSLEYMEKALDIDPDDLGTLIDLAMSYFYNNRQQELSATLQKIEAHPDKAYYADEVQKLMDIIEGRLQWR